MLPFEKMCEVVSEPGYEEWQNALSNVFGIYFQYAILQILPKTYTQKQVVNIETRWKINQEQKANGD